MDFTKLNNEFSKMQSNFEKSEKERLAVKKLMQELQRDIDKLTRLVKTEKLVYMKKSYEMIVALKKQFLESLTLIFIDPEKKEIESK